MRNLKIKFKQQFPYIGWKVRNLFLFPISPKIRNLAHCVSKGEERIANVIDFIFDKLVLNVSLQDGTCPVCHQPCAAFCKQHDWCQHGCSWVKKADGTIQIFQKLGKEIE